MIIDEPKTLMRHLCIQQKPCADVNTNLDFVT